MDRPALIGELHRDEIIGQGDVLGRAGFGG